MLLLVPLLALAQFPQGGGKGGKGGGKGGKGGKGFGDPGQMFDNLALGKTALSKEDITNPFMQGMFDRALQASGSTDGKLTRDQFVNAMTNMQGQFGKGKQQPGAGGAPGQIDWQGMFGGKGKGKKNKSNPFMPTGPTPEQFSQWDREAEAEFRRLDANGDGKLNEDEAPDQLKRRFDRYDNNKDGEIDLGEFKTYYREQQVARLNQAAASMTITVGGVDDDGPLKRPDVFRVGNMPKNMPAWFTEYDTDKDGQVGLYEWRKFGKSLAEFKEYDRNEDGFITADEVIRWMAKNGQLEESPGVRLAQNDSGNPNPPPAVSAPPNNPWANGGMQKFGGKKGKGNKGNKGKRGGGED